MLVLVAVVVLGAVVVVAAVDVVAVGAEPPAVLVAAPAVLAVVELLLAPPPQPASRIATRRARRGRSADPRAPHAAERLRERIAASSAHGRVFATSAAVSHARRAVAIP